MNYFLEIQRAIDFIESNLTEDVTLSDVTQTTNFSMYHFHRIFQAMVGESITDYIRKRRLTEAARALAQTENPILDISLDYQYQSQEAFSRAFKKMYGLTPGKYRQHPYPLIFLEKRTLTPDRLTHLQRRITMQPKIIQKEGFSVIGLEYYGANTDGEIPAMWGELNKRIQEIPNRVNSNTCYGVCSPVEKLAEEFKFFYLAGVEVTRTDQIPEGMVAKSVPAAQYAVFSHKGSPDNLDQTYEYIMGTWLPNSGYEQVMSPDFELYDQRFNPESEDSEMFIYIPIKG